MPTCVGFLIFLGLVSFLSCLLSLGCIGSVQPSACGFPQPFGWVIYVEGGSVGFCPADRPLVCKVSSGPFVVFTSAYGFDCHPRLLCMLFLCLDELGHAGFSRFLYFVMGAVTHLPFWLLSPASAGTVGQDHWVMALPLAVFGPDEVPASA